MAVKSKTDLKSVFNDVSSVFIQKADIPVTGGAITLNPEYDMPVTVDELSVSQDDPTINHYKVIGLDSDWTSSSTIGEMTINMLVPTKHTDVLTFAWGSNAVETIGTVTLGTDLLSYDASIGGTWTGSGLKLKKHKVTCNMVLLDSAEKNMLIMRNVVLWATPVYDTPSTNPFAVRFTGTIESDGESDMIFISKAD